MVLNVRQIFGIEHLRHRGDKLAQVVVVRCVVEDREDANEAYELAGYKALSGKNGRGDDVESHHAVDNDDSRQEQVVCLVKDAYKGSCSVSCQRSRCSELLASPVLRATPLR